MGYNEEEASARRWRHAASSYQVSREEDRLYMRVCIYIYLSFMYEHSISGLISNVICFSQVVMVGVDTRSNEIKKNVSS